MSLDQGQVEKPRVLFICTGNACRSQMAEGLLRHLAGDRFEVCSAGTHPWKVHPLTIEVMAERGIDVTGQTAKSFEVFLGERIDYVIITCDNARRLCPNFPGESARIHWSIDDPINVQGDLDERRDAFRRTRDELSRLIEQFIRRTAKGTQTRRGFLF